MPSPVDPGLGEDVSGAPGSGPPPSTPRYKFFLKIVAKKDCTETMLKSLVSRTHEEIETGQGSWKDGQYRATQMLLLRTVLRSAPPPPPQRDQRRHGDPPSSGLQPRDCCYQFNNDGCEKQSPHPNNDPTRSPETVHHFCKICLRKNIKKVHPAKACETGPLGQ